MKKLIIPIIACLFLYFPARLIAEGDVYTGVESKAVAKVSATAEEYQIYPEILSIHLGEEAILEVNFTVGTLFDHSVDWESGSPGVVSVRQQTTRSYPWDLKGNCMVKGLAVGETTIYAREKGNLLARAYIKILPEIELPSPVITGPTNNKIFLYPGPEPDRWLYMRWESVAGASLYELDIQGCRGWDWLDADWKDCSYYFNALAPPFSPPARENFISSMYATGDDWNFAGDQPGRWRVRTVDRAGVPGEFSEWRYFKFRGSPDAKYYADFDRDGKVDFDDFFMFSDAFGQLPLAGFAKFDIDYDGLINFDDFFLFSDVFGRKSGIKKVVVDSEVLAKLRVVHSTRPFLVEYLFSRDLYPELYTDSIRAVSYGELKSKW